MNKFSKYTLLTAMSIMIFGCSDIGRKFKQKPNESEIHTNNNLIVPPNYHPQQANEQKLELVKEPEHKSLEQELFNTKEHSVKHTGESMTKGDKGLLGELNIHEQSADHEKTSTGDMAILNEVENHKVTDSSKTPSSHKKLVKPKHKKLKKKKQIKHKHVKKNMVHKKHKSKKKKVTKLDNQG